MKNKIIILGANLAAIGVITITLNALKPNDVSYISTAFFFALGMLLGLAILKFSK